MCAGGVWALWKQAMCTAQCTCICPGTSCVRAPMHNHTQEPDAAARQASGQGAQGGPGSPGAVPHQHLAPAQKVSATLTLAWQLRAWQLLTLQLRAWCWGRG